jgi:16S rRNA A1518/A1519 N6-dimethyltransferase RsmA/KsgA/DIM1 with predicted DNA glycosylase/AP lyase activity
MNMDVLETNWTQLAAEKGGPLSLIGNLPFNISSQILFTIVDNRQAIEKCIFTTQLEVLKKCFLVPLSLTPFLLYIYQHISFEISINLFFVLLFVLYCYYC